MIKINNYNSPKPISIEQLSDVKDQKHVKVSTNVDTYNALFSNKSFIFCHIGSKYFCEINLDGPNNNPRDLASDLIDAIKSKEKIIVGGNFAPYSRKIEVDYLKTKNIELKDGQINKI